jgi:signal transduction histidine kinase
MATDHPPLDRPVRVLLVDDDGDDYVLTRELFADIPGGRFHLDWVSTYDDAVKAIAECDHDAFLIDYRLGAQTGIELIAEAKRAGCGGPMILLTGQGQSRTDLEALHAGADDYLEKGRLTSRLLERSILYALRQREYEADLERKVKERTEALAKANDALRDTARRKDEFLATLAHELRNPLAPIRNALEIMRLAPDNPATVERSRAMLERQVAQMVRLIEDLLDVSRITTGKLRVQPEPMTLGEVVENALEMSRPVLDKAQVRFTQELPAETVPLRADRVRMAQVFSNLLNNAAKYTEPGGKVALTAARDGGFVRVEVQDTGVGIPADVLPQVFELFTQVDRTLNRSQGGLGIGLALVRRLVELHGGTIAVHSDGPGTGATFTVRLPVAGSPV